MAVVTLYMSDRDPQGPTFTDRKAADEYDKMLEIAEVIRETLQQNVQGVSEEQAEELGLFIAKNKDAFLNLLKGKTAEFDASTLVGASAASQAKVRSLK